MQATSSLRPARAAWPILSAGWRRAAPSALSGALIAVALAAEHLLGAPLVGRALMSAAALVAGAGIAVRAWSALRHRQASIELLVTLAATGALILGDAWEAAAVTFLFALGNLLEGITLARARSALRGLLELTPPVAIVLREGRLDEVPAEEVAPGETVLVRAGARVPVDGIVLSGRAAVDESAITGEPLAAEKAEGDRVFAGSTNQAGLLQVRAEGVGGDTTVARIIRRVEEAQEERAPAQRLVERFARWYTPAAIALAAVVLAVTGDLERALTLLVIACPGALVMAAPVPVIAGIGRGARRGILIKGGRHLEAAARVSAVALDKTGTITRGQPSLTDVVALDDAPLPDGVQAAAAWKEPEAVVLAWAAVAEAGSEHPLAKPILAAAGPVPAASEGSAHPGRGITARHAGHEIAVGTPDLMRELQVPVSAHALQSLEEMQAAGRSTAIVALDGRAIGLLGITDELRPGSRKAVSALRALGLERLLMLSGDQARAAEAVAAQAGIEDVRARLLPEDKLAVIRSLQAEGHVVAMVGDGINDAPAIAAADVGVAIGAAGSGVALETADIALLQGDLERLPEAIRLARRTVRNIRQNVTLAVTTVAVLLAGVLAGEVHMAGGMLVHEASVLLVILNGMRLLRPEGARPWKS